jgi:acyl-CoA synthetase (AMP-forming)/AMP-acid ligase II
VLCQTTRHSCAYVAHRWYIDVTGLVRCCLRLLGALSYTYIHIDSQEFTIMQHSETLVDLLRSRASQDPQHETYAYIRDGGADWIHISNAALDRSARTIAALLQHLGASGQRVLLLYPPGLEFLSAFFGCLYAGCTAVPAYPPSPGRADRSLPRLRSIVLSCQPVAVLTTAASLSIAVELAGDPAFRDLPWHATDDLAGDLAELWREPAVNGATLAFLQYTSGSTAAPKGVMLSHSNLLHNLKMIHLKFKTDENVRSVQWLPFYHDMGLIGGLLEPLYCNGKTRIISPISFLRSPLRWLRAMSEMQANIAGGPNFGYDLCVRRVTAEQVQSLDLSHWRLAFTGAEPIRAETLERFAKAFAPAGFRVTSWYPCYGLAESTLLVTGATAGQGATIKAFASAPLEQHQAIEAEPGDATARRIVSCGYVAPELQVAIVDQESGQACPDDRIGEIWAAGASVAQGYWNAPERTQETFHATLETQPGVRFLRTGDLGFIHQDQLYVTGRIKDMIIIDGRNHYPQDIEQTVEQCHPAIRGGGCAAFSIDKDGQERLVIVAELNRGYGPERGGDVEETSAAESPREELLRVIRNAVVSYHDLQIHAVCFLKPGSLPKTSSGKIQRHACRAGFLAGTLEVWE